MFIAPDLVFFVCVDLWIKNKMDFEISSKIVKYYE
jgi:hypothetical protein